MSADLYRGERGLRLCAQGKCRREDRNKEAGRRGWDCHYESRGRVSRCCEEPRLLSEQRVVTGFTRIGAPASAIACLLIPLPESQPTVSVRRHFLVKPIVAQRHRSCVHFPRSDAETSHSLKRKTPVSEWLCRNVALSVHRWKSADSRCFSSNVRPSASLAARRLLSRRRRRR
jgi:hypothetical protein